MAFRTVVYFTNWVSVSCVLPGFKLQATGGDVRLNPRKRTGNLWPQPPTPGSARRQADPRVVRLCKREARDRRSVSLARLAAAVASSTT